MGLSDVDVDPLDDGDGGCGRKAAPVSCSICLDAVMDNGDRSWAKLQCGHQFHLDCIGSAFNMKGTMQCPNCRKIEKGQWLYSNGGRPLPEFSMDDAHDDDLHDMSYSEMSFGVPWCPFGGLTRIPPTFDEGEFQSNAYRDLLGHHTIFAEHTPVSSTTHPCPYIAYLGPVHPSSTASGNISNGSSFNNLWSGPSAPTEVPSSYAFPSVDVHYNSWDHSPPFSSGNQVGDPEQLSFPSATPRTTRNNFDIPRPGRHPYILSYSSAGRAPSSVTSSAVPPYPGAIPWARDRPLPLPLPLHAYLQQPSNGTIARGPHISSIGRRSNSQGGLAQVASMASSSDHSSGIFFSPGSTGRIFQEAENPTIPDHIHVWEHEHHQQQHLQPVPAYPLNHVDRDSIWGPFHPPSAGASGTTGIRSSSSFHWRHGSEGMLPPSQNHSS